MMPGLVRAVSGTCHASTRPLCWGHLCRLVGTLRRVLGRVWRVPVAPTGSDGRHEWRGHGQSTRAVTEAQLEMPSDRLTRRECSGCTAHWRSTPRVYQLAANISFPYHEEEERQRIETEQQAEMLEAFTNGISFAHYQAMMGDV